MITETHRTHWSPQDLLPGGPESLAHGGPAEHQAILSETGLDIASPDFWQGGFDVLQSKLDRLERIIGGSH